MASKKDMSLKKGMRVYIRNTGGEGRGTIDTSQIYIIRSIGPKQAILDYPTESTRSSSMYRRPTGRAFYLYTKEEADRYNRDLGNLYPWHWSQVLVPLGKEGWDPEINIL